MKKFKPSEVCPNHPKYIGKHRPRVACRHCFTVWFEHQLYTVETLLAPANKFLEKAWAQGAKIGPFVVNDPTKREAPLIVAPGGIYKLPDSAA